MARQNRKFTPRLRTTRPLGAPLTTNAPPMQPHSPPTLRDQQWIIEPPLSSRLYQKSGIGMMQVMAAFVYAMRDFVLSLLSMSLSPAKTGLKIKFVMSRTSLLEVSFLIRSGGELLIHLRIFRISGD